MKQWFLSLSSRERQMVQVAAVVIVLFLFYLIIWQPISDNYERSKKNVATASETIVWMKSAALEVKRLGGGAALSGQAKGKQFVLGMIDRSARKAGLGTVMKRVQPEGTSGVRVWFENASFDEFIKWLASVQSEHGLLVNEVNIEQTETTGLVNIRVYLES